MTDSMTSEADQLPYHRKWGVGRQFKGRAAGIADGHSRNTYRTKLQKRAIAVLLLDLILFLNPIPKRKEFDVFGLCKSFLGLSG